MDKNRVNFVRVHLNDHREDVAGFSAEERGVYESLRVAYFQRGGPLPLDWDQLYRLAEALTSGERKAVKKLLELKFTQSPDGWKSVRCEEELARIAQEVENKRKAGQASAAVRSTRVEQVLNTCTNSDPNRSPTETQQANNQEPRANNQEYVPKNNNNPDLPSRKSGVDVLDVPPSPKQLPTRSGANNNTSTSVHTSIPPRQVAPAPSDDERRLAEHAARRRDPNWGYAPSEEERQREEVRKMVEEGSLFATID